MPKTIPPILVPGDGVDLWDATLAGKDTAERQARATVPPPPDLHAQTLAYAERLVARDEAIRAGACRICAGTAFWQTDDGRWLCARCHPPLDAVRLITRLVHLPNNDWDAVTETVP